MIDPDKPQPRVMVVDDNEDAAVSLSFLLASAGFKVATAFSGPAAIEQAEAFKPHAYVLDINMPEMSGYELARRLRDMHPDQPPIFATVTAFSDDSHLTQAVDAGFDLHFTKPANPSEVAEQLEDALREYGRLSAVALAN
ncbi:response regulator [Limnoglobus roseus]|uniref:Response regulator n=1 Tax=Limnoglobus roseus TaxID=2598579 RepID=A0A5C1AQW0_9BACT|nr:response regulator [Limnoglobus roseus]QEL21005.1 response regulator [Limnoglobus roseus]